ncbi:hypothetical protein [Clostridium estertheticum]|uniref:hypothetical protein n=1 Tax=Clostridium estertheticum TaxID=238834 RepID=UPI001C0DB793|nr:hypothetical protein [Clostridium estertheticum]MBU3186652.1 hypothetical protein [Clostridium estertheticum]
MRFYIPPNLQRDFTDSLNALGIDTVVNFDPLNVIKIRLDKVNYRTKGSIVSADEVVFAELTSNLKMGDYLQYKNETMLITQLKSDEFPKCLEFATTTCNTKFTITRYQTGTWDDNENVIIPEGDNPIATDFYCSTIFESFEFKVGTGQVGIVPTNQIISTCQYNTDTGNIVVGDTFIWMKQTYRVISLNYEQLDISGLYGLLSFNAEKVISDAA